MEKIFDIAKDSEQKWGVIAQGIDGNFEEVAEKINEVLSEIDGEYAYSFATGVGGIYNVSKDISLKNGETLTIKCASLHGFNAAPYIGLYKDDDTQIDKNNAVKIDDNNRIYTYKATSDTEIAYIKYFNNDAKNNKITLLVSGFSYIEKDISSINRKIDDIESRLDIYGESIFSNTNVIEGKEVLVTNYAEDTRFRASEVNGALSGINTSYWYTEPIKVYAGEIIMTNEAINQYSVLSIITKVDAQGNAISMLKQGNGSTEVLSYTIIEECYISISEHKNFKGYFFIKKNGIEKQIENLQASVGEEIVDSLSKLPRIYDNPLATIKRDCGYGSIIRKYGIIGDSLSSGEMQCFDDTSISETDYKFLDMYQYSWGQQFARLVGASAYNFSNGGQTTHGWLKSTGLVHDESYIGGVGGGGWATAKQSQYLQEGYIIALGVNDRAQINSGNYELGSVSQITTYDGTDNDIDDIATYPKSFCRYYAGIIQRIKSVQPKAKIFCATPIGENYENLSSAIRDIVTKYGLSNDVYLIDLAAYIPDGYKVDGYMLNGHLSPMGYMYMAFIMNTYIDWIIRNNGVKFRDTALIGTGYKPDYN